MYRRTFTAGFLTCIHIDVSAFEQLVSLTRGCTDHLSTTYSTNNTKNMPHRNVHS